MVRAGKSVDGLKAAGVEFFAAVPVMFPPKGGFAG